MPVVQVSSELKHPAWPDKWNFAVDRLKPGGKSAPVVPNTKFTTDYVD